MKTDFRSLANQRIRDLTPYQPGKPIEEVEREFGIQSSIKLASNENPLGPSPKIFLSSLDALKAHIYPDGDCFEIKQALATFLSVHPEQLTIGNGSENILELIVKSYLDPEENAVISEYTFLTIPILIQSYGKMKVAAAKNYGLDVAALLKAIDKKTRIVFLVNPNNPTGTYIPSHDFHQLLESIPENVLVVADEAYSEYISQPDYPQAIQYLHQYPNLIITRTFSKVYGLAALRLGYSISSPQIADILNRARLPFNVNSFAAKAGCIALQDQEHVQKSVTLNNVGMHQMREELKKLRLETIPSVGNFITVDVAHALTVFQKLLREGIIVRPLQAYQLPRHIRVTIGTIEQNNRFLATMKKILKNG